MPEHMALSPEEQGRLNKLIALLSEAGADYEVFTHAGTVTSADEGVESGFGELSLMAPTLIVSTEKGFVAAIISGATRLSYKKIKEGLGLKNVALAKPEAALQATGSYVGTISLINEGMPTIVDQRLLEAGAVYGGCGVPRHTLRISVKDLVDVTRARVFDFTELKGLPAAR